MSWALDANYIATFDDCVVSIRLFILSVSYNLHPLNVLSQVHWPDELPRLVYWLAELRTWFSVLASGTGTSWWPDCLINSTSCFSVLARLSHQNT